MILTKPMLWIAGAVIAALLVIILGLSLKNVSLREEMTTVRLEMSSLREDASNKYAAQSEEFRKKEKGYRDAFDKLEQDGAKELARRDARINKLESANKRLRSTQQTFTAAHSTTTFASLPPPEREAATAALDLLSDLYRGADERAGILAAALDASHAAGKQCEASFGHVKE